MSHSKEPWNVDDYKNRDRDVFFQYVNDANGQHIVSSCLCCGSISAKRIDLERLIACVNVCRCISTERLVHCSKGDVPELLADVVLKLENENAQ